MTREELSEFAKVDGFRPFTIFSQGGLRAEVPHPEFIVIPPGEQTSFVIVFTTGRISIPKFIDLDAIDHIDWSKTLS